MTELQSLLAKAGFSPGAIDGVFGFGTLNAVIAFQGSRCLAVDGFVGAETKKALVEPYKNCHGNKSRITRAVEWAQSIAKDNRHGYSEVTRNGGTDYDCSSFVLTTLKQAGYGVNVQGTTNDMLGWLKGNSFTDVTGSVNKDTGAGLQVGDVLLRTGSNGHTAIVTSVWKVPFAGPELIYVTQATGNNSVCSKQGALWYCGNPGDDNGYEIREDIYSSTFDGNKPYVMHDYNYVLRPPNW